MKLRTKIGVTAAMLCLAGIGLNTAAFADNAVVVGVNKYPRLPGCDLHGCVNDATSMVGALEKNGFTVTLITDSQATKQGILNTLAKMKTINKPGERFVFYFAGHGNKQGFLLPSDTCFDAQDRSGLSQASVLGADTLNDAVRAIPARSRTILLDACFSAALVRDLNLSPHRLIRAVTYSVASAGAGARDVAPQSDPAITLSTVSAKSGVCYFAAARRTEYAQEDEVANLKKVLAPGAGPITASLNDEPEDKIHGAFTYFLVQKLCASPGTWSDVGNELYKDVSKATNDSQKPDLDVPSQDVPIFEGKDYKPANDTPAPKPAPARTVWDDYAEDHANPDLLTITMSLNRPVQPNEIFKITTKAGAEGYLVILDRDASGSLYLAYPPQHDAEKGYVQAGETKTFNAHSDRVGTENARAILFTSKKRAQALIDQLPKDGAALPLQDTHSRELFLEQTTVDFTTADVMVHVVK